jgi:thymidylate synthase (FAD)
VTEVTMTSTITVEPIRVLADDYHVAEAARVSTRGGREQRISDPGHRGLITALMRDKHGSPFEHSFFTFRVHAPLYVMTEHLRHRIGWSYNGESGRYKTFEPVFYTPPAERGVTQVGKAMDYDVRAGTDEQCQEVADLLGFGSQFSWDYYELMLNQGIAREVARQVLPTNLMTTYYTSCNARSLMAFLELRGEGTHALWEIQQVARGYEEAFAEAMPITHAAFVAAGRVAP